MLTTHGPVEVSVNKISVFKSGSPNEAPCTLSFEAPIKKGANRILVCFTGLAVPDAVLAVGLRITGDASQYQVRIPTLIPSLDRKVELENIYERLYLDKDVYAYGDSIKLQWPEDIEKPTYNDSRLQTVTRQIYAQAENVGQPGQQLILSTSETLNEGPYQVLVMPRSWEFYEKHIRVSKKFELWVMGRNRFTATDDRGLDQRRHEALNNAASRDGQIFSEIAKVALQRWNTLETAVIDRALASIANDENGSEIDLLGLLGAVMRYGNNEAFPDWVSEKVKNVTLNYQYLPGDKEIKDYRFMDQDHQIVRLTCQILAGQLYPDNVFSHSEQTGQQLRSEGEKLALKWMRARGMSGFTDWDSRTRYANTLTALSHLVDLAENEEVWELGSVLTDKVLFSIALNSFNGVFGSTQGYATSTDIKSGLLDPTSGITRLMWGKGVYNHQIAGTVSMACLKNYELPPIISDIASSPSPEIMSREQHGPVNKVTFRTPNFMLSSAQDYNPGQPGKREHLWQATLGPQAMVFTNHPGNASDNDANVPNYWLGNRLLPRIAQWKDTLIALYKLPDNDIMGFTHTYFPSYEFDEYLVCENTAFARKGDGYLALTSPTGITLIETGAKAFRELRSSGHDVVWICQMGQSSTDGTFTDFQEKVNGLSHTINGLAVQVQTLRGDTLVFDWNEPLSVNGELQSLQAFLHYDNPYTRVDLPCTEMEIKSDAYILRLKFGDLPQE